MKEFTKKLWEEASPKRVADKSRPPEETIAWVEEQLAASGLKILRGLERVDQGRLGIPVYLSLYDVEGQQVTGKFKQMGKGATEALSRASALMELVERFSLFSYVRRMQDEPVVPLSQMEEALSPVELLDSLEDPEGDPRLRAYVEKLLPEIPFQLAPALSVAENRWRKIPFFWFWLLYEYNGSAAGNTYAEAGVQATCELIERHVSALSHRLRSPMPEIRRSSITGEGDCLCRCFERLGIRLWIRDMTYGMPAPTVAALALDPSTYPQRSEIVYVSGTGTSPERALVRTLTEMAQLAGDFDTEGRYLESALPKFGDLTQASYVVEKAGEVDLSELPDISASDHREELRRLARELEERGYKLFLVDLTHPRLDLPAVYAVVPGLLFRERTRISPLYHLTRVVALYLPRERALPLLRQIVEEAPARYYTWAYLGRLLSQAGDPEGAINALRRALELSPEAADRPAIYAHLAEVYLRAERPSEALKAAEEGLSWEEFPELWNLAGRAYFRLREYAKALVAFFRAVELNPGSAVDLANLGWCLKEMGSPEEARDFFEKALTLDPTLQTAREGLRWCEKLLKREEEAHV